MRMRCAVTEIVNLEQISVQNIKFAKNGKERCGMRKFIDKLIEWFKEEVEYDSFDHYQEEPLINMSFEELEDIIYQCAEEFATDTNVGSNGWIPVSERLPDESLNSVLGWDEYRNRCCFVQYYGGRWILGNDDESVKIIAWQPLPEPYQPKGE